MNKGNYKGPIHQSLLCFPDISLGALINLGDYAFLWWQ